MSVGALCASYHPIAMDPRTRRSPARWLAPLALIAVLVAFAAVVSGSNGGGGTSSTTSATQAATHTKTSGNRATAKKTTHSRFYTVKVGDSLSGIADKTGVPLATIQALNPNVDSTQMTAGQKIRLR